MKKYWIIFVLPALILACNNTGNEKQFTLQGEIAGIDSEMVYLLKREKGQFQALDSVAAQNGVFVFKGKLENPRFTYIKTGENQNYITFFLEPGNIELKANIDEPGNTLISGSESQHIYESFQELNKEFDEKLASIYNRYLEAQKEDNQGLMEEMSNYYDEVESDKKQHTIEFIKNHTNSVVGPFLALRNLYMLDLETLEELTSMTDPSLRNSVYVIDLNERVNRLSNVQTGKQAPEFIMNDTTGNPIALSSLFGNYLLVDFWAAWCGPCRRENPNIVAAYQKYHDHGFDILGVSLDTDRDRWIKAIHDDNLTWHHVSDLAGWANEAAALYAVNSIPSSVLLDPDGIIIARNLKGEALHKKLEEIFGPAMAAR
jgi:peroxiredoxin